MSGVLMVQYRFTTCFNDLWNRLVVSTVGSRVLFGSFFYSRVYSDHIGGLSFEVIYLYKSLHSSVSQSFRVGGILPNKIEVNFSNFEE